MMMLSPQFPSASVHMPLLNPVRIEAEYTRFECIRITVAAERHLVSSGKPCPDHQACRRLAFARWLFTTGRLTEAAQP